MDLGKYIPVAVAVVLVIVALVILFLMKDIAADALERTDTESELGKLKKEVNKDNLSRPKSEYESMAAVIFQAMDGWGTDERIIYETLRKLKNPDDWKQLRIAFGEKGKKGLVAWFAYEMGTMERIVIRKILEKIDVVY